jgi:hypothetical protein
MAPQLSTAATSAPRRGGRKPRPSPVPEQGAVEREIIDRLATHAGRRPSELTRELRLAAPDLPIDRADIVAILPALEGRYGVPLATDKLPRTALNYISELAVVIRDRLAAGERIERRPADPGN